MNAHRLETTVSLRLSYRPSSDLLIGQVDLGALAEESDTHTSDHTETPDADSKIVWRTLAVKPESDAPVLTSFAVVHAMARYEADTLRMLPRDIAALAAEFGRTHRALAEACPNTLERVRYRGTTEMSVHLASLMRSEAEESQSIPGLQREALAVARAIDRFSDAIVLVMAQHPESEPPALVRFRGLARELACTLSERNAMPAPGTSAAVRQALRSGTPFRAETLQVLSNTFSLIDDPARWIEVADRLNRFSHSMTQSLHPSRQAELV